MCETEIGMVRRYYSDRFVAVIELTEADLQVGDQIHIHGHADDFTQEVEALWCEGSRVARAEVGQRVEIAVVDHARVHDVVTRLQKSPPAQRVAREQLVEALA